MTRREYNTTNAQSDCLLLLPTFLTVIAAVIVVVLRRLLERHTHSHTHHSSRKCRVESPLRSAALLKLSSETLLTLLHGVKVEWHLRHAHPVSRLTLPAVGHAHHRLLLRLILLRLLRHRNTGVLGTIRTSKWREGTSTSITCMVMMQRQRLVVVTAPSGFYGSAEDVRESGSLALDVLSAAASEEGDKEDYQAEDCDAADYASGYGAFVRLTRRWGWGC